MFKYNGGCGTLIIDDNKIIIEKRPFIRKHITSICIDDITKIDYMYSDKTTKQHGFIKIFTASDNIPNTYPYLDSTALYDDLKLVVIHYQLFDENVFDNVILDIKKLVKCPISKVGYVKNENIGKKNYVPHVENNDFDNKYSLEKTPYMMIFNYRNKSYYKIKPIFSNNREFFYFHNGDNFFVCDKNRVIFHDKNVVPPMFSMCIDDNGTFVYTKAYNNDIDRLFVKNKYGLVQFSISVDANIYCCNISNDGKYLAFETCHSKNPDFDNVVFVINLTDAEILCQTRVELYHITSFSFYDDFFTITDENDNLLFYNYSGDKHC